MGVTGPSNPSLYVSLPYILKLDSMIGLKKNLNNDLNLSRICVKRNDPAVYWHNWGRKVYIFCCEQVARLKCDGNFVDKA